MKLIKIFALIGFFTFFTLIPIDNPHFWRGTNFLTEFYEPRLAWPWLSSGQVTLGFGTTESAHDPDGHIIPLIGLFDPALIDNPAFDHARFHINEANFCLSHNFYRGFFTQFHIPLRKLMFTHIPTLGNLQGQHTSRSFGDLSLLGGWTINYEETCDIDYVDVTFRAGILFPTGTKRDPIYVVDIANGYNGHYAIPLSFDLAIGWFDWITVGAHGGIMPFISRSLEFDLIYPSPGTIWEVNAYFKADHMILGLSFLFDYSFAHQTGPSQKITLSHNDPQFNSWTMHTLNFLLSYDFATYQQPYLPEIGFFYNLVVGGKRIFNTDMGGLTFGIMCDSCF
ncbi:MAG: hypothetical protein AMXMBFR12_08240 [Candidatus Babeliales bacterium]